MTQYMQEAGAMKRAMTLEQFAKKAGVELTECGPEWGGGRIGYKTADEPNCQVCGFRTASAAYGNWAESTFGKQATVALLSLLDKPAK